jgi:hypothetical protein
MFAIESTGCNNAAGCPAGAVFANYVERRVRVTVAK